MQEAFYETVREAKERGAAVLMSSHNLAETQRICDRVGIIKHGKLVTEQTIADFTNLAKPIFGITFRNHASVASLKTAKTLKILEQTDSNALRVQPTGDIAPALATLANHAIISMTSETADLENEFLEFYGEDA